MHYKVTHSPPPSKRYAIEKENQNFNRENIKCGSSGLLHNWE